MNWISVEDELPKHNVSVLVYYGEPDIEVEIDYLDSCVEYGHDYWANSGDGVTHWMPLPEPPANKQ